MKVLVTGGGTGGHIYPALAVINILNKKYPKAETLYVGTSTGMEQKIVPEKGLDFTTINARGLPRKLNKDLLYFSRDLMKGINQSKRIIKEFTPDVVLGTGGYVCGPVLLAAKKFRIPTVIHEQNAIPGITNKYLSRMVDYTCVSFPESKKYFKKAKNIIVTGNPRAEELNQKSQDEALKSFDLSANKKTILIVSGSRGAQVINKIMSQAIPEILTSSNKIQIIYVTGNEYYDDIKSEIENNIDYTSVDNLKFYPYLKNMPDALASADLVVSRAGATTLAELTAAGKPSILIPSPNVTNNHQMVNASILAQRGAAKLIEENNLTKEKVTEVLNEIILDEEKLNEMKKLNFELGYPKAASNVCDVLSSFIG
ncbi:undecaprenyldiphospho-muramoylpentapeptide beta-N-acetylglucosaminyltransferase [Natranaerobius trueperi]|nr:undecaprenyldiphospho-muramoylpentapeptide beta-N-acetylglucosaminyltransferase [Natranaerobius trueperi]